MCVMFSYSVMLSATIFQSNRTSNQLKDFPLEIFFSANVIMIKNNDLHFIGFSYLGLVFVGCGYQAIHKKFSLRGLVCVFL